MINQLLDEPYAEVIPEVQWKASRRIPLIAVQALIDILVHKINHPFSHFYFEFNGPLICSNQTLLELMASKPKEIEFQLLMACFEKDPSTDLNYFYKFEEMSVSGKCGVLGISDYLSDRNLNTLALYVYLLTEARK